MPKRDDIKTILVIGSGPIVIGQACEFDYSGAQACKVLKADGYRVVLVNSNPATIMTDPGLADRTYVEPITTEFVEQVIAKELSLIHISADILVRDGKIVEIGTGLTMEKGVERDLGGKIVVPGLVDMHVHLREPGFEQKEDIASGTRAAAHGGFTAVCCMPNTKPVIDSAVGVEYVQARAAAVGKCRVHVAGSCSQGLKGETLSEMGDMVAHGAVAFTDDGRGVQGAGMMRRVMDYASQFDRVVMSHCQDEDLVGDGQVNEGVASTRLGMLGWPAEGEEIQIARDIAMCRLTGCPLHIQHLTTARGLELVRAAKAEGLPVTCEVTPHHLFLTEDAIGDDYNTFLKVNPPLRTAEDAAALVEGVKDGTVDAIVTDHTPHTHYEMCIRDRPCTPRRR